MKAIGYIRVSTEEQAREGVSLDTQRARIIAWCQSRGYQLGGIYSDEGISGFKMKNRPGIQKALRAVKKGDAFIVFSLSRFSRSLIESLIGLDTLTKRGVEFVSLSENIDTTTAMGKAQFAIMATFSQLWRDTISEQTISALQHKKDQGEKTGGDVPFGYDVIHMGFKTQTVKGVDVQKPICKLVENKTEQKAIRLIQRLRAKGHSLRSICRELEKEGHRTKTGKTTWNPKTVSMIIKRAA